jgi:hypothetical protein
MFFLSFRASWPLAVPFASAAIQAQSQPTADPKNLAAIAQTALVKCGAPHLQTN